MKLAEIAKQFPPEMIHDFLAARRPNLYLLYVQAWRNDMIVNGLAPLPAK